MTTKLDVIRVHQQHPHWDAHQIAAYLGCGDAYVRATAYRCDLSIKCKRSGQRLGERTLKPDAIRRLGKAAQAAGLTVADIQKISENRRVHALAAVEAEE